MVGFKVRRVLIRKYLTCINNGVKSMWFSTCISEYYLGVNSGTFTYNEKYFIIGYVEVKYSLKLNPELCNSGECCYTGYIATNSF